MKRQEPGYQAALRARRLPRERRAPHRARHLRRGDGQGAGRRARCCTPPPRATARSTRSTRRCARRCSATTRAVDGPPARRLQGPHPRQRARARPPSPACSSTRSARRERWSTVGASTNIIEASWRALVDVESSTGLDAWRAWPSDTRDCERPAQGDRHGAKIVVLPRRRDRAGGDGRGGAGAGGGGARRAATRSPSPSGSWAAAPSTATASPLTDEMLADCQASDAVLLGAVGGPKWDDPRAKVRPGAGAAGPAQGAGRLRQPAAGEGAPRPGRRLAAQARAAARAWTSSSSAS